MIIRFGTGTMKHTVMSYDVQGSYFDLDMKMMEPGYMYGVSIAYYLSGKYTEDNNTFKFRVE